jgi:signal transduction histidine kinase
MKKILLIGMLCLINTMGYSQSQHKLDSLKKVWSETRNDTVKMTVGNLILDYYVETDRDSAMFYTEYSLVIAKKLNQPLWVAQSLLDKAYLLQQLYDLPLALKTINEARTIVLDDKNEKNAYVPEEFFDSKNPKEVRVQLLTKFFHQLGNTYGKAGNWQKAISSYKEEIRLGKENNLERALVTSNLDIGSTYMTLNRLDSAKIHVDQALFYSEKTGYKIYQGPMFGALAEIYFRKGQIDSAKVNYWKSLRVNKEQNNLSGTLYTYFALAKMYESLEQIDSMQYYARLAYQISSDLKVQGGIEASANLLSNVFKIKGNVDSAFAYLSIAKTIGDSLLKEGIEKLTQFQNASFEEQMELEKIAQESVTARNKTRTTALIVGIGLLGLLVIVFFRNNRQKQRTNKVLESTLTNLKSTQAQLIQSEKMASLGELTAGIAHEIQNPLNFVNNFSEVSNELIEEIEEERAKSQEARDETLVSEILQDVKSNLEKINHHGKRADAIVKGMLEHSRKSEGTKTATNLNALADEYLRLSYHGLRAKDKSFNADFELDLDPNLPKVDVIPQDIGRVLLNLINNAFYAVNEPSKGSEPLEGYKPIVTISTKNLGDRIEIAVSDNGPGIPDSIKEKIFQPFFTTKPTGSGTGLGLSLSYDIVKAHGGEIIVSSDANGSVFTITIPNHS